MNERRIFGDFGTELPDLDLDCFDCMDCFDGEPDETARYIRPKLRPFKESRIMYEHAAELAESIDIERGARYDVVVSGNFIFGDFIEAFMIRNNCKAIRMDITSLSLSQDNIDSLRTLLEKSYVDNLNLIVSAYFYAHEIHRLIPYIYDQLDINDRFQLAVCGTHMKTCLFETLGGKKIIIHGSANLRSSGNIEQFTIEENPELYGFYKEMDDNILKTYPTINKELRGERLFDAIHHVQPIRKE